MSDQTPENTDTPDIPTSDRTGGDPTGGFPQETEATATDHVDVPSGELAESNRGREEPPDSDAPEGQVWVDTTGGTRVLAELGADGVNPVSPNNPSPNAVLK